MGGLTASGLPKSVMSDHVILLHGLWMRGFALALLRRRLFEQKFVVHRFEYMSVAATQQRILERLRQRMVSLGPASVHLVGHSLGGLLALRACADAEGLPPARIVCLGSPLKGSAAARGFAHWGGEMLLGHNRELLEQGFNQWSNARQVGMVAGRMPLGLGAVLGHLQGDHDGTVAVEETRQPWLSDHCVIETSHTGLLLSADVALGVGHFLRQGSFTVGVS
jgi:pimeloyl-ACP methyl ester carboxylesterase